MFKEHISVGIKLDSMEIVCVEVNIPCREEYRRRVWRWILAGDSREKKRSSERGEKPPNTSSPLLLPLRSFEFKPIIIVGI